MRKVDLEPGVALTIAGFSVMWLVLALASSGTTYHLAPLIVVGFPAVATSRDSRVAIVLGVGAASVVAIALTLAGRLSGPSLLPWGDAGLETAVAIAVGAIGGLIYHGFMRGSRHQPIG